LSRDKENAVSAAPKSPRPTRKNRCEIRSTPRAAPRSAQDDARGRKQHIPATFLPVEIPSVFAVLFEAAKAKFFLCNSRVRLSKNTERVCRRALCAVMALSHQGKLLNSALPNSV